MSTAVQPEVLRTFVDLDIRSIQQRKVERGESRETHAPSSYYNAGLNGKVMQLKVVAKQL